MHETILKHVHQDTAWQLRIKTSLILCTGWLRHNRMLQKNQFLHACLPRDWLERVISYLAPASSLRTASGALSLRQAICYLAGYFLARG
jgi:hypothetical protein